MVSQKEIVETLLELDFHSRQRLADRIQSDGISPNIDALIAEIEKLNGEKLNLRYELDVLNENGAGTVERLLNLIEKAKECITLLDNSQDGYYRANEHPEYLEWQKALKEYEKENYEISKNVV